MRAPSLCVRVCLHQMQYNSHTERFRLESIEWLSGSSKWQDLIMENDREKTKTFLIWKRMLGDTWQFLSNYFSTGTIRRRQKLHTCLFSTAAGSLGDHFRSDRNSSWYIWKFENFWNYSSILKSLKLFRNFKRFHIPLTWFNSFEIN